VIYHEIALSWLQSAKLRIKESTYARYYYVVSKYILPYLGQYKINQISNAVMNQYIEGLLKYGGSDSVLGLSNKSVSDILTIVKSTLLYAKSNGYAVLCDYSFLSIKRSEKEIRILTKDEQKRLSTFLLCQTDNYKLGVLISLYTGMRLGEVCALKWKNINLETKSIKVIETMQRIKNTDLSEKRKTKVIISEPKSKCSIREIPIPACLLEIIESFYSAPNDFVLSGSALKYVEPRNLQYHFHKYVKEVAIENVNYHSLRHTFATRCVELGFEIKSLSEILGHANVNITLNRYVHSSFELKMQNMNRLSLES
jgi:integrase